MEMFASAMTGSTCRTQVPDHNRNNICFDLALSCDLGIVNARSETCACSRALWRGHNNGTWKDQYFKNGEN